MTPSELKQARHKLGLSQSELAILLGYDGNRCREQVYKMEVGLREIREAQRRLVEAYLLGYRPPDWPDDAG